MAPHVPGAKELVSGARLDVDVLIFVDVAKAMADGIRFMLSTNNVRRDALLDCRSDSHCVHECTVPLRCRSSCPAVWMAFCTRGTSRALLAATSALDASTIWTRRCTSMPVPRPPLLLLVVVVVLVVVVAAVLLPLLLLRLPHRQPRPVEVSPPTLSCCPLTTLVEPAGRGAGVARLSVVPLLLPQLQLPSPLPPQ
jgi:hypothetical protein